MAATWYTCVFLIPPPPVFVLPAIGCGNPFLPDSVELVQRNYTHALLKCQEGFFFHDVRHPFGQMAVECEDGLGWDRLVPNCKFDTSTQLWCAVGPPPLLLHVPRAVPPPPLFCTFLVLGPHTVNGSPDPSISLALCNGT